MSHEPSVIVTNSFDLAAQQLRIGNDELTVATQADRVFNDLLLEERLDRVVAQPGLDVETEHGRFCEPFEKHPHALR